MSAGDIQKLVSQGGGPFSLISINVWPARDVRDCFSVSWVRAHAPYGVMAQANDSERDSLTMQMILTTRDNQRDKNQLHIVETEKKRVYL